MMILGLGEQAASYPKHRSIHILRQAWHTSYGSLA